MMNDFRKRIWSSVKGVLFYNLGMKKYDLNLYNYFVFCFNVNPLVFDDEMQEKNLKNKIVLKIKII